MKAPTAIATLLLSAGAATAVDFARDVRPLLAAHCTECHGGVRSKAGLSFVRKDSAFAEAESGKARIAPGHPELSELVARITSGDEDERMPPEEPLAPEQIETLRAWIAAGAEWPQHWSLKPIAGREGDSIDALVGEALRKRGVQPSPEAPRHTLIRRLSLDLLGLPPRPAEVAAFVADPASDAYQKLVDKTLASPHFGERWARHWLDAARYADSDGYEKDNPRADAWRWRKWVIDAINDDMPFDQFTVEQLAGDLLPDATPEQKLATAFHRQTLFNREGGVDPEEDRTKRTLDRTNTTASVWLGLTVECAQCHDHPYDPITQREYYALYAFFNDASEGDVEVAKGKAADIDGLKAKLDAARTARAPEFEKWFTKARSEAQRAGALDFHRVEATAITSKAGATFAKQDDGSYLVAGGKPLGADVFRVSLPSAGKAVTGLKLEVLPDKSLAKSGPGRTGNGNFVLSELRVTDGDKALAIKTAIADFAQKEWSANKAIDGDRATGWAVSPQMGKAHHTVYTFAEPLSADEIGVELDQNYPAAKGKEGHQIGRFRISLMTGGSPFPDLPEELQKSLAAENVPDDQRRRLADHFFANIDVETKPLVAAVNASGKSGMMKARVMRAQERKTYVFHRGDFLQPKKDDGEVIPGTPRVLPATFDLDSRVPNRLDLARWIVDPANPLAARVAANDIWTRLFGSGLVDTKGDWGTRCEPPLHAELLDHLASEFVERGWSRKTLIRHIVLSETYRQDSAHRPEATERDPTNALLHRQNRFRLEGEILRDVFLSASGLLEHKVGSPSVFPPIPADVAAQSYANSFKWKTSTGADRYRRGMYTFFKRTAADPNLLTFDCPDANVSVVERNLSNTPIMALATLGNTVFHEAAQALAKSLLTDSSLPDDAARIGHAFGLCVGRPPTATEAAQIATLLDTSRRYYRNHPDHAAALTKAHPAAGADPTDNAAWVATARVVLNLDETLTRP